MKRRRGGRGEHLAAGEYNHIQRRKRKQGQRRRRGGGNDSDYDCGDIEEQQQQESVSEKKKSEFATTDEDEEGHEEEMKWSKKSKKVKNPTETLLNYINVGQKKSKKKEVSFELAIKKKKRKSRKLNRLSSEEANFIEEKLVCSLMDYRHAFPGHATVQLFLMNGK